MKTTEPTRDAELDAIRKRCQAATPGPWEFSMHPECTIQPHVQQMKRRGGRYTIATPVHSNEETARNMDFIAHAREDIPALLARLEASENKVAQQDKILDLWPVCLLGCVEDRDKLKHENRRLRSGLEAAEARAKEAEDERDVLNKYIGDPEEHFEMLWEAYGSADDSILSGDAQDRKKRLRAIVGIDKLESQTAHDHAALESPAV